MEQQEKFGLTPMAARKRASMTSMAQLSLKENDEAGKINDIKQAEATEDVDELDERMYTDPLVPVKACSMKQRLISPEFQPSQLTDLYPLHKHLLIKRSQRCRECEHNLCKPEFSPSSIKFKIQLVALYFVPEIRLSEPPRLECGKETKLVLTLCNPADHAMSVSLRQADEESDTATVKLPSVEMTIAPPDDTAEFDESHQEVKDDPKFIAFRKTNKIGVHVGVTPRVDKGVIKATLFIRYNHRSMASALTAKEGEKKEPEIIPMEQKLVIKFGQVLDPHSKLPVYSSESLA